MGFVDEFRAFNRFYTRRIGLLQGNLPGGDLPLPMARVLYEIAKAEAASTAAGLTRELGMDKAHMSRVLARLGGRGLIARHAADGRRLALSLTPAGRSVFDSLDRASAQQVEDLLADANSDDRLRLSRAFSNIRAALGEPGGETTLRALAPGDVGWIVHRQGLLYHREYAWDWTFEALVARILAGFVESFDPAREAGWVADRGGAVLGSIFLMKSDDPAVGKLRLLYVEPQTRGEGLGGRLVDAVIARAREIGYSALNLWTNDILTAARRIYIARGFQLIEEAPHRSFGADLVGQTWRLDFRSQTQAKITDG
jgi:DNA-binding MarR family transcriptional regulator/N-acetylglutamate synthase-like GNAT family acetyltransferase